MGAQHNIKRYEEIWPDFRIKLGLEIVEKLKTFIILSGGWAWNFMSPPDHIEYKHAHDHKNINIFVNHKDVAQVMDIIM